MRCMALCFAQGDARAQLGFWLGWVWFGGSHPTQQPHPTQTQPNSTHSEDEPTNNLATQGLKSPRWPTANNEFCFIC